MNRDDHVTGTWEEANGANSGREQVLGQEHEYTEYKGRLTMGVTREPTC